MSDRLEAMWKDQQEFMELLREKREFPSFPLNLSKKSDQKFIKNITHECMHELFEANQKLSNSKDHRITEVNDLDRDEYVEELIDSLHYFFEIAILSGVSMDELFAAYMKKGEINRKRIATGY